MRAVIHAGMHKTGSSSIQQTFGRKELRNFHYPPLSAYNHSIFLGLLFDDNPRDFQPFANQGLSDAEIERQKAEHWLKLGQALEKAREKGGMILSGEHISSMRPAAKQRLHDYLARHFDEIDVLAYVRPPVSYMQSAFQQNLKGTSTRDLDPARLWPGYRRRFESLDAIFGRDKVRLKLFDRTRLADGNVVRDFAAEVGEEIAENEIRRVNESLSLEAIALLFVQRRYGDGFVRGFKGAPRANADFIKALGRIGGGKFVLAPELVAGAIEANRADIEWMEDRLGTSLIEAPGSGSHPVAGEADLLAIAEENEEALDAALEQALGPTRLGRLVMDMRRKVSGRTTLAALMREFGTASGRSRPAVERLAVKLDILRRVQL